MALKTLSVMKEPLFFVRHVVGCASVRSKNAYMRKGHVRPWKVMFFGTDDFSLGSLVRLNEELKSGETISQLEVVTSKWHSNPVKLYSQKEGLVIHEWPINGQTVNGFTIGLVASFGHLIPKNVIDAFPLGMLNVHGSLLPRWRGAAPVNYAIMHGDSVTGISIMRIQPHAFDKGDVISTETVEIYPKETAVQLRARLSEIGGEELLSCVRRLPQCLEDACPQLQEGVSYAPKLTADLGVVSFEKMTAKCIYNRYRALHGSIPLVTTWMGLKIALHDVSVSEIHNDSTTQLVHASKVESSTVFQCTGNEKSLPGQVQFNRKGRFLEVTCSDNLHLVINCVAPFKKRPMSALEFYNGYLSKQEKNCWIFS